MPEGDTIFRTARTLQKALAGRVVTGFETALAKLARVEDEATLVGRVVEKVEARGKWLLIYFSGGRSGEDTLILVTHMLMHGSWHLYRVGERWRLGRGKMRVVVRVQGSGSRAQGPEDESQGGDAGWEAVLFNAQIAEFHTGRSLERNSQIPKLGADVLAADFTVEAGMARLEAYAAEHPEAEVGVVLLNQRVLAGLGNVYKSEVAFAAEVNPWRRIGSVTRGEMEKMVEFAMRYMRANVADGAGDGIVTYGGNRRTTRAMDEGQRLWVYKRAGQECRRCGGTVQMRKQGVQARSTYWCDGCQR